MQYGTVNDELEATVRLNALGIGDVDLTINFVIDTGCSEEIILPQDTIDQLQRTRSSDMILTVADGTTDAYARYRISVEWHGQPKEVIAVSMPIVPLIGMRLLRDSNLSVDATPGGSVIISELPLP